MENEVPAEAPPAVVIPQPQPERKPFRFHKWHVVTIVLMLIIAVQVIAYLPVMSRYNALEYSHRSLLSEHATLEGDYGLLEARYDSFLSDYDRLRDEVNKRATESDVKSFITPQNSAVRSIVLQATGGWSNTNDWDEYWSDLKNMYDWVVNNIDYRSDGLFPVLPTTPSGSVQYQKEMWQLPSETLDLEKGDCEDMAILLTSMIRCYNGEDYKVECIEISGSSGGHVAVQIPVAGDKLTILDPAGHYYTQTWLGSLTSGSISAEINDWLGYWRSDLGSNVHVTRVFSSYVDETFSSTTEYTTWMSNR
jgi:hypothetical protein